MQHTELEQSLESNRIIFICINSLKVIKRTLILYSLQNKGHGVYYSQVIARNIVMNTIWFKSYVRDTTDCRERQREERVSSNRAHKSQRQDFRGYVRQKRCPVLQASLNQAGKVLYGSPTFFSLNYSYCYYECYLQVRNRLVHYCYQVASKCSHSHSSEVMTSQPK